MKQSPTRILASVLFALSLALAAEPAAAQSDILLQLRSGSPAGDRFRVDSAGGIVAMGILGLGIIPYTGDGERLMWHPYKAAFRAGSIGSGGNQWDDGNVGFYSWAGGYNTTANGLSSIAFGYQSSATGSYATAIGYIGNATGTGSVALGYRSTADASYAVAIGQRASANGHTGAIVFSDASTTDSTEASANNQFTVRAAGGVRLFTNAVQTTGVNLNAGGSSWNVISDRNRKLNFTAIDGETLLSTLDRVPVTRWQYRDEEDRTTWHVGPMAQDWHAAFRLSSDSLTINSGDLDGVNLAAIQALTRRTDQQSAYIRELKSELAELRAAVRLLTEAQREQ